MTQAFREFEVGERTFRAFRLSAFEQFSVAKLISPIFGSMASMLDGLAPDEAGETPQSKEKLIEPFIKALSALDDEQLFEVCRKCMRKVKLKNSGGAGWSDILADNGKFMYEDIEYDLFTVASIIFNVVKFNLEGFMAALPSNLKDRASNLVKQGMSTSRTTKII